MRITTLLLLWLTTLMVLSSCSNDADMTYDNAVNTDIRVTRYQAEWLSADGQTVPAEVTVEDVGVASRSAVRTLTVSQLPYQALLQASYSPSCMFMPNQTMTLECVLEGYGQSGEYYVVSNLTHAFQVKNGDTPATLVVNSGDNTPYVVVQRDNRHTINRVNIMLTVSELQWQSLGENGFSSVKYDAPVTYTLTTTKRIE